MKHLFRSAAAAAALVFASIAAHAAAPGYVDLGKFKPADGCEFVEVNLHAPLLKFAAMFVGNDDPKTAELIRSLKHVHVNVVGYNDSTRVDTSERVHQIRRDLESQGWTQMVTVQQGDKAEDVAVFVKMADDESIAGLVVTVLDSNEKHAVFVNLVGNIKAEQLAAVGKGLHIDPLEHLKLAAHGKGA